MNFAQKSERKQQTEYNNVSLPFIYPMRTDNGDNKWPFSEKGFALINGTVDQTEKCVRISEESAVIALNCMGYFGDKYDFESNNDSHSIEECGNGMILRSDNRNQNHKMKSKYSNGKYVLVSTSVPNAVQSTNDTIKFNHNCDQNFESKIISDNSISNKIIKSNSMKLSFLEAFFLSYCFGCLNVFNSDNCKYMTIEEMWNFYSKHYNESRTKFASYYCAYHYFRSKGWVVRNGLSFGSDFLLYKEGPPFYHALYSVTIIEEMCDGKCEPDLNWHQLSALIRLNKNVRKEVLLCYVNVPKLIDCLFNSPNSIRHFNLKLLTVDRCISASNNNEKIEKIK